MNAVFKRSLVLLSAAFLCSCGGHRAVVAPDARGLTAKVASTRGNVTEAAAIAKTLTPKVSVDLRPEMERLTLKLEYAGTQIDSLTAELLDYQGKVEKLAEDAKRLNDENTSLSNKLHGSESALRAAGESAKAQAAKIDGLEHQNAKLVKDSAALGWWHRYVRNPALCIAGASILAGLIWIAKPFLRFFL